MIPGLFLFFAGGLSLLTPTHKEKITQQDDSSLQIGCFLAL